MKYYFLILLFWCLPVAGHALGVSVSPASLEIFYPDNQPTILDITNISEEPIVVLVESDDFVENFSIQPIELKLLPDEVGQVMISADLKHQAPGLRKTNISVITKAIDKKSFNAVSGIKIPLTVYISENYFKWSGQAVFVVVFLSLFVLAMLFQSIFWIFKGKRKKKKRSDINLLVHHKKKKYFNL